MKEYDIIEGCLSGLAIGDALGAPFEWMTSTAIQEEYPNGIHDFISRAGIGVKAGEVTDDTEMAFLVANSILKQKGLDMTDIASRLISWADNYNRGIGPSTGSGIEALRNGVHWSLAGNKNSPSSGCLPRCIPVALVTPVKDVLKATVDCCKPTHQHPEAIGAAVALNLILCRLVEGYSWNEALKIIFTDEFQCEGATIIRNAVADLSQNILESDGAAGVFKVALNCVNRAENVKEAIIVSISAGGDTDTCGAVAGALEVELPVGTYAVEWILPETGEQISKSTLRHEGGTTILKSPSYKIDIALSIKEALLAD